MTYTKENVTCALKLPLERDGIPFCIDSEAYLHHNNIKRLPYQKNCENIAESDMPKICKVPDCFRNFNDQFIKQLFYSTISEKKEEKI